MFKGFENHSSRVTEPASGMLIGSMTDQLHVYECITNQLMGLLIEVIGYKVVEIQQAIQRRHLQRHLQIALVFHISICT